MPDKPRILLVDDDRLVVLAMTLRLKAAGYDIFTAFDGQQGVASAAENQPDAIVLDIHLPVMDGLTALGKIRENQATRTIPVILVGANPDKEMRDRGIELGARHLIPKPYDPNHLTSVIESVLK